MSRLKPGEGYTERRERRKRSRRRQQRKQKRSAAGEGVRRMMLTVALLRAGRLPLKRA